LDAARLGKLGGDPVRILEEEKKTYLKKLSKYSKYL
jgi:hypothetical protein